MVKTAITEEWQENRDYKLIPRGEEHWHIEILKGEFSSCIISYSKVSVNEESMELTFDYNLEYSPIEDLKAGVPELSRTASHILHSLLMANLNEMEEK